MYTSYLSLKISKNLILTSNFKYNLRNLYVVRLKYKI